MYTDYHSQCLLTTTANVYHSQVLLTTTVNVY